MDPKDELQMRDWLHHPSQCPEGVLACQRWNAPAHLTLAERKQIPMALNNEIAPYRLDSSESCELRLWFEHLILQISTGSHNTNFSHAAYLDYNKTVFSSLSLTAISQTSRLSN